MSTRPSMNVSSVSRRDALGMVAASTVLLAGGKVRAQAPAPKAIRIAGGATFESGKLHLGSYAYIVEEQGWLKEQLARRGIALEWFPTAHSATGPMINEGFANGRVDFAGYGDLPSTILNASGVATRIVMPHGVGNGDGFLVVPPDSKAQRLEDLKGKTIAVHRGRPWELPLARLIEARGLKYSDFRIYNINPSAGMAALAAGHVDALFTMTDAYLLEQKQLGRIIWSTKHAPLDWKTRTDLFAAKSFIERFPDLTQLVVTAYVKAAHWAAQEENREALIRIGASTEAKPEIVVRRSYEQPYPWKERWSPLFNPVVSRHYQHTVEFAVRHRMIGRRIDANSLLEPRFVTAALAQPGLRDFWQPYEPESKVNRS
jgi:sulfonate transport system substrate-binding protein